MSRTSQDHDRFLSGPIDDDLAELLDHPPAVRSHGEAVRMNSLLDQLAAEDERRDRQRCLKLIEAMAGEEGLKAFLTIPQPALEDRTGAWLLQNQPAALLERLEFLHDEMGRGDRE